MPYLEQLGIKYMNFNTIRLKFVQSFLEFPINLSMAQTKSFSDFDIKDAWVYCRDEDSLEVVQFDKMELITTINTEFMIISKRNTEGLSIKYLIIDNFEVKNADTKLIDNEKEK